MATNPSLIITDVLKAADRVRRSSDHTNPAHSTHAHSESVGNPEPYGELIQPMCVCGGGSSSRSPPLPSPSTGCAATLGKTAEVRDGPGLEKSA